MELFLFFVMNLILEVVLLLHMIITLTLHNPFFLLKKEVQLFQINRHHLITSVYLFYDIYSILYKFHKSNLQSVYLYFIVAGEPFHSIKSHNLTLNIYFLIDFQKVYGLWEGGSTGGDRVRGSRI